MGWGIVTPTITIGLVLKIEPPDRPTREARRKAMLSQQRSLSTDSFFDDIVADEKIEIMKRYNFCTD